jgi:hypothetical protein
VTDLNFLRSQPVDEVIILGAGFSKAINEIMPTADELGERATAGAEIQEAPQFVNGRFETWLSRLSESQPDLTAAQNAANAAKFARLVEAIHGVMTDAQDQVTELPDWLARLITTLHYWKSTVVSFNYDTLVERAVESLNLWDFGHGGPSSFETVSNTFKLETRPNRRGLIGWHNLLNDVPALPPPGRSQEWLAPSFQLLKLHGSLNWYWVPGDNSGATLNSWHLLRNDPEERRRYLPGREPFIVPPAATKSPYFNNPIMREIWRTAGRALKAAEQIHFVGYSLPATDLLSSSMIADGLSGRSPAIWVVNRAPAEPQRRLATVTSASPTVTRSVAQGADGVVADTSRRVVEQFVDAVSSAGRPAAIAVGWNLEAWTYVTGISVRGGAVVVTVGDPADHPRVKAEMIATADELASKSAGASQIVARFVNRKESVIVGLDGFGRETGPTQRNQVLVPADPPGTVGFRSGT